MSIGNLKDYGNKGNNFPYQLKVLEGLQCTCDQLKALGVDTAAIEATLLDIETALGSLATEATLQAVEADTASLVTTTSGISSSLASQVRAPRYEISSTTGTTLTDVYSFAIANVGAANGFVDGSVLLPGVTINFNAGALNNTLATLGYDATGTTFVITYVS
jgi:hypothetical protein